MTDAFWTTLIASSLSAGAALGGVHLTNRHTFRRQRFELQEKARGEQREIISEIVLAGRNWVNRQELWIPMVSKMTTNDILEFGTKEASRQMGEVLERLNVALVKADLFIPHGSSLKEEITWLAEFVQEFPEKVLGPVMDHRGDFQQVLLGLRALRQFSHKLLEMSKHASAVLAVQPPEDLNSSPKPLAERLKDAWQLVRKGKGV